VKTEKKRDQWGDLINTIDTRNLQENYPTGTYIWQKKHSEKRYLEVYDYNSNNQPFEYEKEDLIEVELFKNNFTNEDDPSFKDWVWKYDAYSKILNKYFYDILALNIGDLPNGLKLVDISKVLLPKSKLEEIDEIILEYGFEMHRDFFIYLIAKTQSVYVENIFLEETTERENQYLELGKDVKGLIKFLEKVEKDSCLSAKESSVVLEGMRFVNEWGAYYTIRNSSLIEEIILPNYSYLQNLSFKELKKYFQRFAFDKKKLIGGQYQRKFKFREVLAKSLHNFLTETELFKLKGKKILDPEAYYNARIINSADIPLFDRDKKAHDILEDKANIISLIKSWCSRTKIESIPFIKVVQPNFEVLKHYFEDSFLKSVNTNQKYSDIFHIDLICSENKIISLKNEIAHLIKCANNFRSIIKGPNLPLGSDIELNQELLINCKSYILELFLIGYCKNFYKFLLNENPPKEGDYFPSIRYINIIAQSLIIAGVFPQYKKPNEPIIKNIKIWLEFPE
jgi:hypothetical protein